MTNKPIDITLDYWEKSLLEYSFSEICFKNSPETWSIGQMYLHLIADTTFYLEQISECIRSAKHSSETASAEGREMIRNNEFPDMIIEGSPSNALIPQPESKESLVNAFLKLRDSLYKAGLEINSKVPVGKTKHPGLGYFNAYEWLQFADMHFRHHLRQKKRLDHFIKINHI